MSVPLKDMSELTRDQQQFLEKFFVSQTSTDKGLNMNEEPSVRPKIRLEPDIVIKSGPMGRAVVKHDANFAQSKARWFTEPISKPKPKSERKVRFSDQLIEESVDKISNLTIAPNIETKVEVNIVSKDELPFTEDKLFRVPKTLPNFGPKDKNNNKTQELPKLRFGQCIENLKNANKPEELSSKKNDASDVRLRRPKSFGEKRKSLENEAQMVLRRPKVLEHEIFNRLTH